MKQSTVKALGIATIVIAGGAIVASALRDRGTGSSGMDTSLLPVLGDRVNDVAKVEIESKDGPITLEKSGDGWTLAEKAGYDANPNKVRELILALRSSKVVEEKTANQERFGKLGLNAPDAEDSSSKRVTLKDAGGETIATALIGNRRTGKGGFNPQAGGAQPEDQYYVHTGEDRPAVLATGKLQIDARAVGWVEQQFLDVARDRIKAARVTHPDGTLVEAVRADMDAQELQLLTIPDGKEPKEPNGTRPFLDALSRMRFDDVEKSGAIDFESAEITKAEFFTEHGVRITVETIEVPKDDAEPALGAEPQMTTWARFTFDAAPDEAPAIEVVEAESAGEASGESSGDESAEGENAPAVEAEEPPPTVAELQREASELAAPVDGWIYAIPSWKTTALRMPLDDLVQDIPPPPAPEPEPETETETVPAPEPEAEAGDVLGGDAATADDGSDSQDGADADAVESTSGTDGGK